MTSLAEAFKSCMEGDTIDDLPTSKSLFYSKSNIPTIGMDYESQRLAREHDLTITQVAWEDTGRTKGSCWGPNISDMTLVVSGRNQPIIRKPNFADLTSDQDISSFSVNVGNENGTELKSISLKEYLENITKYTDVKLSVYDKNNNSVDPESAEGIRLRYIQKKNGVVNTLYDPRDEKILVSAQACVLPLKDGTTEFAVKLYNYQSVSSPAVLVVVASSQGTSAHFVLGRDNTLDFNKNGKMAKFVAERLKDDRAKRGVALEGEMTEEEKLRNALLIFQIPLNVVTQTRGLFGIVNQTTPTPTFYKSSNSVGSKTVRSASANVLYDSAPSRGMDHAMISTSEGNGYFPSLSNHTIGRNTSMPIRCTIQYYHVTDDGTISSEDMAQIASEVVRHKPIGSLVVGGKTERPTEHSAESVHVSGSSKLFNFL